MKIYKYYKHIVFRETPYAPLKGRNPITEEMAQNENHFKLTFDSSERLIKVEYKYGEQIISPTRAGKMDGSIELAPITEIQYEENLEIRHFFDEGGKASTNQMKVYKAVYEYNDNGERVGLKFYDKENKPTNNSWDITEYIWEKVDNHKVLEKRKNVSNEFAPMRPYYLFMNVVYEYDSGGMLTSMTNVDDKGKLKAEKTGTAIDKPVYDDKFQLTSFKFYDENGKNIIGSFLDCASGEITYDEKGNATKYMNKDLEGNPKAGTQKFAWVESKYDRYGNIVEDSFFDENGMPSIMKIPSAKNKEFTKVQFIYDEKNPALNRERIFHN